MDKFSFHSAGDKVVFSFGENKPSIVSQSEFAEVLKKVRALSENTMSYGGFTPKSLPIPVRTVDIFEISSNEIYLEMCAGTAGRQWVQINMNLAPNDEGKLVGTFGSKSVSFDSIKDFEKAIVKEAKRSRDTHLQGLSAKSKDLLKRIDKLGITIMAPTQYSDGRNECLAFEFLGRNNSWIQKGISIHEESGTFDKWTSYSGTMRVYGGGGNFDEFFKNFAEDVEDEGSLEHTSEYVCEYYDF